MIHQICCTSQVLQPLMNCNGNNQINFLVPGVAFGIALAEIVIPVSSFMKGVLRGRLFLSLKHVCY